ncbi:MAG: hypothetical protein RBU37_01295 [Myxococcota bacterium]|jgi:hypothetical protein|nr:hypothetical protein [Myxococcota bacterium]
MRAKHQRFNGFVRSLPIAVSVIVLLSSSASAFADNDAAYDFEVDELSISREEMLDRPGTGWRILAELGGGFASALVVGVPSWALAREALVKDSGYYDEYGEGWDSLGDELASIFIGGVAGLNVGYPMGVWASGELMGGQGAWWAPFLGSAVGSGLGILGSWMAQNTGSEVPLVMGIGAIIAAPIIAYELSDSMAVEAAPSGLVLVPSLALSPDGMAVGLAGRF